MSWSYDFTFSNQIKGYLSRWLVLRAKLSAIVGLMVIAFSSVAIFQISSEYVVAYLLLGVIVWLVVDYGFDVVTMRFRVKRSYRMTGSTKIYYRLYKGAIEMRIGSESYTFSLHDFSSPMVFDGAIVLKRKGIVINNKISVWFMDNKTRDVCLNKIERYLKNGN